jgi:hypothetical protein
MLLRETPLTEADLLQMGLEAVAHSFLDEDSKADARAALLGWTLDGG